MAKTRARHYHRVAPSALLLALALAPASSLFHDHRPRIRGDSYSYTGDGGPPGAAFFHPDDTFVDM